MKKYAIGALAAAIAALFLIVGSAGFTAANAAPTIKVNEFCKKADLGKIVGSLRCEKDGQHNRWKPYTPPVVSSSSKSASASSSASASASSSASATSSASSAASATPPPNSASSTDLPLTGAPVGALIGIGAGVLALGGLLYLGARRRTRFTP